MHTFKYYCLFTICLLSFSFSYGQLDESKWKLQFALGINSPSQDGFVRPFVAKGTNFPTINIGIQHMLKQKIGVKLDAGHNRISNDDESPEFKLNYTRINGQFVYDTTTSVPFLPLGIGLVLHTGPGYSIIKPLGEFRNNDISFLNFMGGVEFHYTLSKTVSAYVDGSYIYGFAKEFEPITSGQGSFNSHLLTVTIGLSVSLSGCKYCN